MIGPAWFAYSAEESRTHPAVGYVLVVESVRFDWNGEVHDDDAPALSGWAWSVHRVIDPSPDNRGDWDDSASGFAHTEERAKLDAEAAYARVSALRAAPVATR